MTTTLIITTYNQKEKLELVLASVLSQTVFPDEVIVADDGSTHDTKELVNHYQALFPIPLLHCWQEDEGFRLATIRNKAIALTQFEYIIMIDGDIVMEPRFIDAHKKFARAKTLLQASRVLLGEQLTERIMCTKQIAFNIFTKGINNRLNTVRSYPLARLFSYYNDDIFRVRGANMSFWKEDVVAINGFNEAFVGWGREDSEFVARLQHNGVKKRHLKFAGIGYHLYHLENSKSLLPQNETILQQTVATKATWCRNGIDKYLTLNKSNLSV